MLVKYKQFSSEQSVRYTGASSPVNLQAFWLQLMVINARCFHLLHLRYVIPLGGGSGQSVYRPKNVKVTDLGQIQASKYYLSADWREITDDLTVLGIQLMVGHAKCFHLIQ